MKEKIKHFVIIFLIASIFIYAIEKDKYNINDVFRTVIGALTVVFCYSVEDIKMDEKLRKFIITFFIACIALYCFQGFTLDLGNLVGIVIGDFIVNYWLCFDRMED